MPVDGCEHEWKHWLRDSRARARELVGKRSEALVLEHLVEDDMEYGLVHDDWRNTRSAASV